MKKVGKTTRPFRYDLNQIPKSNTVEVRNRFKELDLIDRMPEELWTEVPDIVQKAGIKTLTKKNTDTKGTFHAKMDTIKDRSGTVLAEAEDMKKRWQERSS